MKIGTLGSGVVSHALAKGFIKHGYDVIVGPRDATKFDALLRKSSNKVQKNKICASTALRMR